MSDREGYLQRRDRLLMQDEEIAELKAEQQELVYDCRDHRIAKEKAMAEVAELREAIQTHRDSFGPPEDHTEEDRALWAALKEQGK